MIDWVNISLRDLAGFISEELRKKGIDIILVGGGIWSYLISRQLTIFVSNTVKKKLLV